ncbi:cysteine--tRNA ligase [Candidatus Dependentiae bacterium]|nr:cysteine--tRNA ligase [Candidatus Dependentiae bacterium]
MKKFFIKKEAFVPVENGKVKLYGCGVTPYDHAHIGHGRSYVFIDTLVRFLKYIGYDVTYVRNVTDIDDKLLKKAEAAGDIMGYRAIAKKFTELYQQEMRELNCLAPNIEPTVTDNIDAIIGFIEGLIKRNKAYVVNGDVYFDVASYGSYGELSGKNLDDLLAGARVEVDTRKKSPADFALWKGNKNGQFWKSPWGYGRPGWHIECSALAKKCLGVTIDIHCGGMDLLFPHHENERAQSESLHDKPFANYWIHNALLNIDKKKMSKSLGNILSLQQIFETYDPMVLRYYFLQHHYRTPIEFSFEMLDAAQVAYKKLVALFEPVSCQIGENKLNHSMVDALCDDLNTPRALGILFENLAKIRSDQTLIGQVKNFLVTVFGLTFKQIEKKIEVTPEIERLLLQREAARLEKRWGEADRLRDRLRELGYGVQDKQLRKN